jgi:hypothetical protein
MASRQVQKIVAAYRVSGQSWPATKEQIALWAVRERKWLPQTSTLIRQCADEIADAMRLESFVDPQGRNVRAKYSATMERNGTRLTLWDDGRTASREFMAIHFAQRRQAIAGDCRKMKSDMDSYNDNRNPGPPIQTSFDFTRDMQEGEIDAAA